MAPAHSGATAKFQLIDRKGASNATLSAFVGLSLYDDTHPGGLVVVGHVARLGVIRVDYEEGTFTVLGQGGSGEQEDGEQHGSPPV